MSWQQSTNVLFFLFFLLPAAPLLRSLFAAVADLKARHVVQVCCKAELKYQDERSGCPEHAGGGWGRCNNEGDVR